MTWKVLAKHIGLMTEEQKNTDVTFWDSDQNEYFALNNLFFTDPKECDVLDPNHPFLVYNQF